MLRSGYAERILSIAKFAMDADLHNIQHIESFLGATRDNVVSPPDFTVRSNYLYMNNLYTSDCLLVIFKLY